MAKPIKRTCEGECGQSLVLNKDNFAPSAKGSGGVMKICRKCHGLAIKKARTEKRKTAKSGSTVPKAKPSKIEIDFSGKEDLYKRFISLSKHELREPAVQALYIIQCACETGKQQQAP